jgi:hypothetical protein
MVEHESKMAEIQRIQEEKLNAQHEKERQREMEIAMRRKEVYNKAYWKKLLICMCV